MAKRNPYFLLLRLDKTAPDALDEEVLQIDLDENGWLTTYEEQLFRRTGQWHLVRRSDNQVVFSMRVNEGDQPYYTARHIGIVGAGAEVVAYSIGKKTRRMRKKVWHDNEDNLWVLPWGQVCGGTDVEYFAKQGLLLGLPGVHK